MGYTTGRILTNELLFQIAKKYKSKSEFNRQTTLWAKIILEKTAIGKSHKGYKAWEIKDE